MMLHRHFDAERTANAVPAAEPVKTETIRPKEEKPAVKKTTRKSTRK